MNQKLALKIIFAISVIGILFSGTLTYQEFFGENATSCPAPGGPGTILGFPPCVYGLIMYIILFCVSGLGLTGASLEEKKV